MSSTAPARLLAIVAGAAAAMLLAVGLVQLASSSSSSSTASGSVSRLTLAQVDARLEGSPAPLAALHAQASQILPGDARALHARLTALRGYPLVINKWASWCVPCQGERGAFQRASATLGRTVAFLGIDSGDTTLADGRAFLRPFPVGYPSYYDQSGRLGAAVTDSSFTPVTIFYDRAGHQYIHQGPYPSAAKLERDVRRYALDA
ncbi:MAG TPA: TlpA disulfide reductase family protein [Solirubrobacteraceae bacterium]|nr:TlpA disulfide reductase family protein [Solirubrobacteraceae bacterium]